MLLLPHPLLLPALPFLLRFGFCASASLLKMGLVDLPVELLVSIIDYIIPKNWKYYSEGRSILKLRLLCSKPFILSLHFAVSQLNSSESFHDIVSHCAFRRLDINAKNEKGRTALSSAAKTGHEAVVRLLLEHMADVNVRDKDGLIALLKND